MATLQGSFSRTSVIGTRLESSESSYNVSQNTSNVHVKFYVISINGGYTTATTTGGTATVTVNGESKTIIVPNFNIAKDEVWLVGEKDFTVKHGEDGKKTVSISSYLNTGLGSSSLSGSLKLTDIPRKSTFGTIPNFTFDSNENVGVAFSVPITKNYSAYYNVLKIYVQNENSVWILVATRNDFNGGNVTFTVDELQVAYSAMARLQSTFFKFELVTYENSSKTKTIGTDIKNTVRGSISMTGIEPALDLTSVTYQDTNNNTYAITENRNIFIKKYSNIKVTFTEKGTANKGAYLGDNSHAVQVKTVNGSVTKSLNYSDTFPASLEFEKIADKQIDVFVFDSRNIRYPAYNVFQTVTMWEYNEPSFELENCKVYRTNGVEASSFINLKGTYHVFSEKPGVNTIISATLKYKEKGSSLDYTQIDVTSHIVCTNGIFKLENYSLGNLDVASEYEFVVEIKDMLSLSQLTSEKVPNFTLNSAKPYIWHQKNKKIMGIGGKPNSNLKEGSIQTFGGLYLASGNEVLDYEVIEDSNKKICKLKNNYFLSNESVAHSKIEIIDNNIFETNETDNGKKIYGYRLVFSQAMNANTQYTFDLSFANEIAMAWVDLGDSFVENSKASNIFNTWTLGSKDDFQFQIGIIAKNQLSINCGRAWNDTWTFHIMIKFKKA